MEKEFCNNCGTRRWQTARAYTSCDYCGGKPSASARELLDALEIALSCTGTAEDGPLKAEWDIARKWRFTFGGS